MRTPPLIHAFLALALAALLPTSAYPSLADTPFVWIGAVSTTRFTVHVDNGLGASSLTVWTTDRHCDQVTVYAAEQAGKPWFRGPYGTVRVFNVPNLDPGTRYYFALEGKAQLGSVTTFPHARDADEVVFGLTSCQAWSGRSAVWEAAAKRLPEASAKRAVLFMHAGDLHYANIAENSPQRFKDAMVAVVTDKRAAQVFRHMQVSYMYDDHDSGANDADGSSPSRPAVLENYERMVPHAETGADKRSRSYHAFSVASVRFVVSDLRTEANQDGRMMSDTQLKWLLDEFGSAGSYSAVVWLSSRPWIALEQREGDDWGVISPKQRKKIANFIADNKVHNLIMLSGDMHALAADSGVNSDYSDAGSAGFPVFHGGPAANPGSAKGGPYSEGCHASVTELNYHYATVRLYKLGGGGGGPCVRYDGYRADKDGAVVTFKKCAPLGGVAGVKGGGQGPTCKIG